MEQVTRTQANFERFHANNPHVYDALVRLARQWISRFGQKRLGIARLYEAARWEIAFTTDDPEFKINNDHRAFYARLIMANEPDLQGLFNTRRSAADSYMSEAA